MKATIKHPKLCDDDESDCENWKLCCFDCTKERCVWRCKGVYEDCTYLGKRRGGREAKPSKFKVILYVWEDDEDFAKMAVKEMMEATSQDLHERPIALISIEELEEGEE